MIRAQNVLRKWLALEVHRYWETPQGANVLALAVSDLVLRRLQGGGRPSDICFIQVGAHDGITSDPIHDFVVEYGFKGVCVEPQPEAFARLEETYRRHPGVQCLNAAIAAEDGATTLFRFRPGPGVPGWAEGLASFSREELVGNFQSARGEVEALTVPTITPETLRLRYKLDVVDLVQVDTEGFDFEVIKLLDLERFRPTILHFESGLLLPAERHSCYQHLAKHGYSVTPNGATDTLAYLEPAGKRRIVQPGFDI